MVELTDTVRELISRARERLRDWLEYRLDEMTEATGNLLQAARGKVCRHQYPPEYEEMRYETDGKVSWMALHRCPNCEEILSVEASYWGDAEQLKEALERENA